MKWNLFKFTKQVVIWLGLNLKQVQPNIPVTELSILIDKLDKIRETRGIHFTLEYCKATRNNLLNYLSSNPIRNPISRCDKGSGIPIILGSLSKYVKEDSFQVIAMILTVLSSTRALKFLKEPSLDSITQPVKGDVPDISKHMAQFWKDLGYRPCLVVPEKFLRANFKSFRLSKGPNGHALRTALLDVRSMPETLIDSIDVMAPSIGNIVWTLKDNIDLYINFFEKTMGFPTFGNKFRRIAHFPDKEGKQRLIGILDYYSQITLKPLHIYLERVLKKIPQDCTFDQMGFKKNKRLQEADIYYSVDLSNATDRFPIEIISDLLKTQLPSEYINAWKDIMVGYPFDYKDHKLIYGAGNPMGAYSSFNSFALTHHYLIYYLCKEHGISWKKLPYSLLGDDIVIGNALIGEKYKDLLKSIHVDYSPAKTHISSHFYEFAKRIIYKGVEITPFPISALKACGKSYGFLTLLLIESADKGYIFDSISSSVGNYMGVVKNLPSRVKSKVEERSWLFGNVLQVIRGAIPASEFIMNYCGKYNLPYCGNNEEDNSLFSLLIYGIFQDSAQKLLGPKSAINIPLVEKLASLTQVFNSFCEENPDMWHHPFGLKRIKKTFDKTPSFLAAWAVIEMYVRLEELYKDQSQYLADWTYMMKQITVPTTDESIVDDYSFRQIRTINTFIAEFESYMKTMLSNDSIVNILPHYPVTGIATAAWQPRWTLYKWLLNNM